MCIRDSDKRGRKPSSRLVGRYQRGGFVVVGKGMLARAGICQNPNTQLRRLRRRFRRKLGGRVLLRSIVDLPASGVCVGR